MMMGQQLIRVAVLTAVVLCNSWGDVSGEANAKPMPPVAVKFEPMQQSRQDAAVRPGEVVDIRILVTPSVDASEVRVGLHVEGDGELVAGDREWKESSKKGVAVSRIASVRKLGKRVTKLAVNVELYSDGKLFYSTRVYWDLQQEGSKRPDKPSGKRQNSRGEGVVEHR